MRVLDYHMQYAGMAPSVPRWSEGDTDDLGGGFIATRTGDGRWNVTAPDGSFVGNYNTRRGSRTDVNAWRASDQAVAANQAATASNLALYGQLASQAREESFMYAQMTIDANLERFPEIRETARETAVGDIPLMNRLIESEFQGALDRLYPQWREDIVGAAAEAQGDSVAITKAFRERVMPRVLEAADTMSVQALRNTESLLRGEIPDDVARQLRRNAAEIAQQIGSRGQAAQYLTARDLGRTSLDLMQQGLANAPAALSLGAQAYSTVNQVLQMPVASAANVTNVMAPYRAPLMDVGSVYQNTMGMLTGVGTVSPSTALQVGAQVGTQFTQMGQQAGQFQTELAQQSYWNQMNYSLQQQAIRASQGGGGFSLGGAIAGGLAGIAGGPAGIAAGAAAGGFAPMLANL